MAFNITKQSSQRRLLWVKKAITSSDIWNTLLMHCPSVQMESCSTQLVLKNGNLRWWKHAVCERETTMSPWPADHNRVRALLVWPGIRMSLKYPGPWLRTQSNARRATLNSMCCGTGSLCNVMIGAAACSTVCSPTSDRRDAMQDSVVVVTETCAKECTWRHQELNVGLTVAVTVDRISHIHCWNNSWVLIVRPRFLTVLAVVTLTTSWMLQSCWSCPGEPSQINCVLLMLRFSQLDDIHWNWRTHRSWCWFWSL